MGIVDQLHTVYKGKKVFVTGHTGFKGSWLLMVLDKLVATVKGYSLSPERESLYNQIEGDLLCDSVLNDIRDRDTLKEEIKSFQPDFIFHLAAQALVRSSYELPAETFETNVIGTINVLEALRELSSKCTAVIITTDKVYENSELGKPFVETDPLGGHDPYSASKAAAEIVISSYRESFFKNSEYHIHQKSVSSARAGNVVGGGDWSRDRLIPDIIRSLSSGTEIVIRNPKAIRPWQHVLEPLLGYLILGMNQFIEPQKYNEAWNFGPEKDHHESVEEIVNRVIRLCGYGKVKIVSDGIKAEAQFLKLDIAKVKKLGWRPQLALDEILSWTIDWYKRVKSGESARKVQVEQLDRYLKLLS